jgi:hypothetical protein
MMLPFDFGKAQAHSGSASKFNMHGNEEQSQSEKMEVDSVVTLKVQPIESKVISSNGIFSISQTISAKQKVLQLFQPLCLRSYNYF